MSIIVLDQLFLSSSSSSSSSNVSFYVSYLEIAFTMKMISFGHVKCLAHSRASEKKKSTE